MIVTSFYHPEKNDDQQLLSYVLDQEATWHLNIRTCSCNTNQCDMMLFLFNFQAKQETLNENQSSLNKVLLLLLLLISHESITNMIWCCFFFQVYVLGGINTSRQFHNNVTFVCLFKVQFLFGHTLYIWGGRVSMN